MTTPQGILELADKLDEYAGVTTEHWRGLSEKDARDAAAALRLSASPAGNGGREEIARIIWNGFARQGGAFDHAKGTVAYEHCMSVADAILALTSAVAPDGAREALQWIADQVDCEGVRASDLCLVAKNALALPAVVGIEGRAERALFDALNGLIIAYGATDGRNGNSGECWDKARAAIALASHPHQPVEDSVLVPKAALAWLFGEAPDPDGKWFGECEDAVSPLGTGKYKPKYWWRSKFRKLCALAHPLEPATEAGEPK